MPLVLVWGFIWFRCFELMNHAVLVGVYDGAVQSACTYAAPHEFFQIP